VGADLIVVLSLAVLVVGYTARVRQERAAAQRHLERALQSEHVFSESFQASAVPSALFDLRTGHLTAVNFALEAMTGRTREALVGTHVAALGIGNTTQLIRRMRRSGRVREQQTTLRTCDGSDRNVLISAHRIVVDGADPALMVVIDRTDHHRAVAALQSTDQRMRELAENIDEVFWVASSDRTQVFYVSPAYEKVWGRTCESLHAEPRSWLESVLPEDRAQIRNDQPSYDYRITRPDGTIRWIRERIFPVRDERAALIRLVGVASDITEQRLLEEQVRQAQKMESLGMLAGGIAHDFNNLLAVISSCSGLLAETIEHSDPERELVEDIADAVVRASAMTRQLLAFSRKQVTEPVVLDPNIVVNDTRKLLRRILGVDIELITSLEPDLRPVFIDRGHLVQVILNLAVNARDAMPTRGRLQLTTRNADGDVVLEVTDTGSGMSPEVLARACEPFFTTKEQGKGTGMGLAVVHGIVDGAHGKLEIASELGEGTTFRISLPAFEGPIVNVRTSADQETRGVENILLVDDDDHVRRVTARALRSRGYSVVEATNGRAALVALTSSPFDLLLSDIVMPGMSGRVLAEAALHRFPDLKVLFMTGYTDDDVVHDGVSSGSVDLIEKPFTINALAGKVRSVLDASNLAIPREAATLDALADMRSVG
jgi:PAS domain S-box-containing protein